MAHKKYVNPREAKLRETIIEFKTKLTEDELFDLLVVGEYIYRLGDGLGFVQASVIIAEEYSK